MLFLYTLFLAALAALHRLLRRRVAALERRYAEVAREADLLLRETPLREGNSSRSDPYQVAKRQYRLGQLAQRREQAEARYTAWQARADRLAAVIAAVRRWKGRAVPYAFGAVDVTFLLAALDLLGMEPASHARTTFQALTHWLGW